MNQVDPNVQRMLDRGIGDLATKMGIEIISLSA
ncbi:MAG: hypothetical protein RL670_49, partial [Actinomycetota bacterium]